MRYREYDRDKALEYAHRWAYSRNPQYYDFENLGGDCTNFISQIIYSGNAVMNPLKDMGWYYYSLSDRSPSWSGAEFLYRFLTKNKAAGPVGAEVPPENAIPADIIQLSFDGQHFSHSLCIVEKGASDKTSDILVAAHSFDCDYRPLNTYYYEKIRFVHISHINLW